MLRAARHSKSTHTEKQGHTALGETLKLSMKNKAYLKPKPYSLPPTAICV